MGQTGKAGTIDFEITLHEKRNFGLTKICKKGRKDRIFISFRMFSFHGNIIFSELSFKWNVRKQHLSTDAYSCVNMKFLYTISARKDVLLQRKQVVFHFCLGQRFVDNIKAKRSNLLSRIAAKGSHWLSFR